MLTRQKGTIERKHGEISIQGKFGRCKGRQMLRSKDGEMNGGKEKRRWRNDTLQR